MNETAVVNAPKRGAKKTTAAKKATVAPLERVSEDFVIVQRDEYHVALKAPIENVISTRNPRDRFMVTGFFVHAWRDSARTREISVQARKERRVGVPHDTITTIKTHDPRVAAALRKALATIGVE